MHAKIIFFFGLTFNALLVGWVFFFKLFLRKLTHVIQLREPICICTLISILKYTRKLTQQPYDNLLPNTIVIGWIIRFASLNPALYPCKKCLVTWRRCMSKRFFTESSQCISIQTKRPQISNNYLHIFQKPLYIHVYRDIFQWWEMISLF